MLEVVFSEGSTTAATSPVSQWSINQMLMVGGLSLCDRFEVTYSHSGLTCGELCLDHTGKTYGDASVIPVPALLLRTAGTITVAFEGYSVTIEVQSATEPEDYDGVQDTLDQDEAMITQNRLGISQGGTIETYISNAEIDGVCV